MKKNFLILVIGIIIGISIKTLAYTYNANEVVYRPSNTSWKVNNIKSAIDDLYQNKKVALGETYSNSIANTMHQNNTVSIDIPKGQYICNFSRATGNMSSTSLSNINNRPDSGLSSISGCDEKESLSSYYIRPATDKSPVGNYLSGELKSEMFYCKTNESSTVSYSHTYSGNYAYIADPLGISCTKID